MTVEEKADKITDKMKSILNDCKDFIHDEIEFKVQLYVNGYYDLKKELDLMGFELTNAP